MERQHQMLREKQEEKQNESKRDLQQTKQQSQLNPAPSSPSSTSPEFSFTISLHPSAATTNIPDNKNKSPPPFAIDLSPADEIFFHGHLLPLHLLSHLSSAVTPRSSTNSLDSLTLPIKELSQHDNNNNNNSTSSTSTSDHDLQESCLLEGKGRGKSKPFSLFGLTKWRRKGSCEAIQKDQQERQKRKSKFDISQAVKRYMRLVKPFLISLRNRRVKTQILRKPYSFSGNLQVRSKKELRGRRGEYSAPASMITSPTNSGLLVASGTVTPTSSSDSTLEELQAAIQAAIAHCKQSIATEDKTKLP